MLVIGLTGSIGSGKSTVANLFAERGVPVIDADVVAREVTAPNLPAYKAIVARFGNTILKANGTIDRSSLREIIFTNSEQRRWLEALLHPIILNHMEDEIEKLDAIYCIVVIPLLLESDAAAFIDRILVVDMSEETQLARAALRDNSTLDQIKAIMVTQLPRKDKLAKADDIINNAGTPEALVKQVEKLHQMYLKLKRK
jgi:dephospho-CoA kinase